MTARILVTGGTGTLGRLVVKRLTAAGAEVRVLSRSPHETSDGVEFFIGDLATGRGIDAAAHGADVIVHCAGSARGDEVKAEHLVGAASRAGSPHLVNISVVGADRIPVVSRVDRAMFGYFASKRAAERIVAESGLPFSTVRATQFHELTLATIQQMARLPIIPVPAGFAFQPISADEVAVRMTELALGRPAGSVPDLGGPHIYPMADLVGCYLRAIGRSRPVVRVPMPGRAATAIRSGANLAPENALGIQAWEEFLADRVGTTGATKFTAER
jgi:uncharacterized protein YbjT (DUF2867 family)